MSLKFKCVLTPNEHKLLFNAFDYLFLDIFDFEELDLSGKEKSCFNSAYTKLKSNSLELKFTLGEIEEIFKTLNYIINLIETNEIDQEIKSEDFPNTTDLIKLKEKIRNNLE